MEDTNYNFTESYLQIYESMKFIQVLFKGGFLIASVVGFLGLMGLTWAGYVAPWSGRFYSLWDTGFEMLTTFSLIIMRHGEDCKNTILLFYIRE